MINSNTAVFNFECSIYALSCPVENKIMYIGKTKQSLKRRLSMHINQKSNCKKSIWIKELINIGLKPEIILIEVCDNKNWRQREIYHISTFGNLLNENKGGAGGVSQTNNYIDIYNKDLSSRKSNSTVKNYTSVISKFLKYFNSVFLNPIWINSKMIDSYLRNILNKNTRNSTIIALKDFYSNIINQPNKLNSIKYVY